MSFCVDSLVSAIGVSASMVGTTFIGMYAGRMGRDLAIGRGKNIGKIEGIITIALSATTFALIPDLLPSIKVGCGMAGLLATACISAENIHPFERTREDLKKRIRWIVLGGALVGGVAEMTTECLTSSSLGRATEIISFGVGMATANKFTNAFLPLS